MCGSVFGIRIRIQKAPEYGFNTDPDPQHRCKLKVLKTFCFLEFKMNILIQFSGKVKLLEEKDVR